MASPRSEGATPVRLTVEISMYPLAEAFVPPIRAFIERLNGYDGLRVSTYPTCTVVVGEHAVVMDALHDALAWSQREFGRCVFVTKFITGYDAE
jgi:uncharacterized protein YqgV (UPF0045/DUF77 family)